MNQYNEQDDPLFSVDALMGKVLNVLAAIGMFCMFLAVCFIAGWLS